MMAMFDDDYKKRASIIAEAKKVFEWDKWDNELPYLSVPEYLEIRAVPAFNTGIIRYNIRHREYQKAWVSIYFDAYQMADCMEEPHYELYPYEDDTFRIEMGKEKELMEAVIESINKQLEEQNK